MSYGPSAVTVIFNLTALKEKWVKERRQALLTTKCATNKDEVVASRSEVDTWDKAITGLSDQITAIELAVDTDLENHSRNLQDDF